MSYKTKVPTFKNIFILEQTLHETFSLGDGK